MRLVQVVVPGGRREGVLEFLDEEGIDYVATDQYGDGGTVIEFPLPPQAVEYVLDELERRGVGPSDYTVVLTAETANTEGFEALAERFIDEAEGSNGIARDELRTTARDMTPGPVVYYSMTLLSALVATVGLLLDSAAVVVGSMVIAPQVGSALTASLGTVLDDGRMVVDGVRSQLYGLALAVLGATAFGLLVRRAQFVPPALDVRTVAEIGERIAPGALSLVVGAAAGAAGAFGLATAVPVSLVGVMIAAALIPAAATVGIGLAWGFPSVALGAAVLLLVNLASINLAAALVFWWLGYRPDDWSGGVRENLAAHSRTPAVLALVASVVIVVVLGGLIFEQATHERQVNDATEELLDREEYDDLAVERVSVRFGDRYLTGGEQAVTVVVERPPDEEYPLLAGALATYLAERTGEPTSVTVEFRDRDHVAADAAGSVESSTDDPTLRKDYRTTQGKYAAHG